MARCGCRDWTDAQRFSCKRAAILARPVEEWRQMEWKQY